MTIKTKPEFGILILGFNRPRLLERTLGSLTANSNLTEAKVFLSLDGPRGVQDTEAVSACRRVLNEFAEGRGNSSKLYSESNRGLRAKVTESVTEALNVVDRLLVLEDDCLIGNSSIDFFNWGFRQFDSRKDIGVISGTYLGPREPDKAFVTKRFSSWGWAINKETWHGFLESWFSQVGLLELRPQISRFTASDPFAYRFEYKRISKVLDRLDSWAIPFDMFLRSENLLAVKPTVNQIQNIGFGDTATHTAIGSSLSIETGHLDLPKLHLASPHDSVRFERAEAWRKFGKLSKEFVGSHLLRQQKGEPRQ